MKRWLLVVFGLLFLLVLAACGGGSGNSGSESSDTAGPEEETAPAEEREADPLDGGQVDETSENATGTEEGEADDPQVEGDKGTSEEGDGGEVQMLTVDLMNGDGDSIGTAELSQEGEGVRVVVEADGLEDGLHGFHFHENGACEGPDFESAGAHFNPTGATHGTDSPDGPHAGDMPNLQVEDGQVRAELVAENVTLQNGQDNALTKEGGTALVIHANEDDNQTDPSGNSGDRIACGIIPANSNN